MAEYDHVPGLRRQLERAPRSLPRLAIDPAIRSLDDLGPLLGADTEIAVMKHFVLDVGYACTRPSCSRSRSRPCGGDDLRRHPAPRG